MSKKVLLRQCPTQLILGGLQDICRRALRKARRQARRLPANSDDGPAAASGQESADLLLGNFGLGDISTT